MVTKIRNTNIEILRIITMFMIVFLHCLGKGNVLFGTAILSVNWITAWGIEAFCVVAVNCYVLISGFFLVSAKFDIKKIFIIWGQTLFYSVSIYLCLIIFKVVDFKLQDAIYSFFPVLTNQYWFVNCYFALYLIFPFLNKLIYSINQKQYQFLICISLLLYSIWPVFFPFVKTLDQTDGYGIIWFVVLYLIAGYIKLYDVKLKNNISHFLIYIVACILMITSKVCIRLVAERFQTGVGYDLVFFSYNSILTLIASIGLFLFFLKLKQVSSNKINKFIISVSSLVFGVYLIHEQTVLREVLWTKIFPINENLHLPDLFLYCFYVVVFVFVICICLEWIRQKIYSLVHKKFKAKKNIFFEKINSIIN